MTNAATLNRAPFLFGRSPNFLALSTATATPKRLGTATRHPPPASFSGIVKPACANRQRGCRYATHKQPKEPRHIRDNGPEYHRHAQQQAEEKPQPVLGPRSPAGEGKILRQANTDRFSEGPDRPHERNRGPRVLGSGGLGQGGSITGAVRRGGGSYARRLPAHPKMRSRLASGYFRDPQQRPIMRTAYTHDSRGSGRR